MRTADRTDDYITCQARGHTNDVIDCCEIWRGALETIFIVLCTRVKVPTARESTADKHYFMGPFLKDLGP